MTHPTLTLDDNSPYSRVYI